MLSKLVYGTSHATFTTLFGCNNVNCPSTGNKDNILFVFQKGASREIIKMYQQVDMYIYMENEEGAVDVAVGDIMTGEKNYWVKQLTVSGNGLVYKLTTYYCPRGGSADIMRFVVDYPFEFLLMVMGLGLYEWKSGNGWRRLLFVYDRSARVCW